MSSIPSSQLVVFTTYTSPAPIQELDMGAPKTLYLPFPYEGKADFKESVYVRHPEKGVILLNYGTKKSYENQEYLPWKKFLRAGVMVGKDETIKINKIYEPMYWERLRFYPNIFGVSRLMFIDEQKFRRYEYYLKIV